MGEVTRRLLPTVTWALIEEEAYVPQGIPHLVLHIRMGI